MNGYWPRWQDTKIQNVLQCTSEELSKDAVADVGLLYSGHKMHLYLPLASVESTNSLNYCLNKADLPIQHSVHLRSCTVALSRNTDRRNDMQNLEVLVNSA
ncbi:uncharacterized protein J5F26_006402 isoform 2-T2 [Ciconia maguari]